MEGAFEAKVPLAAASSTELTIGHNVGSKEEVDEVMEHAQKAGATIVDPLTRLFLEATLATSWIRTGTYGK